MSRSFRLKENMWLLIILPFLVNILVGAIRVTPTSTGCLDDSAASRIREAQYDFTYFALRDIIQTFAGQNANTSPFASYYSTAIVSYFAAQNSTLQHELFSLLKLTSRAEALCAVRQEKAITNNIGFPLSGNNVFGDIQYPFTNYAKEVAPDFFYNVNFKYPSGISDINKIIQIETNNGIKEVLSSEDSISTGTQLGFVIGMNLTLGLKIRKNGIIFNKCNSKLNNPAEVPLYIDTQVLNYTDSEAIGAQFVAVPCNGAFRFILVVPHLNISINTVNENLKKYEVFNETLNSMRPTCVTLISPDLKNITTKLDAQKIAQENMLLSSLYEPRKGQFKNLVKDDTPVASSFSTETFSLAFYRSGLPKTVNTKYFGRAVVKADRPFIYYVTVGKDPIVCGVRDIRDKSTYHSRLIKSKGFNQKY